MDTRDFPALWTLSQDHEVLAGLSATNGETAPTTVYRALAFLAEHGFIHRLASLSSYLTRARGFRPRAQSLEVLGECETCRGGPLA